MVSTADIDDVVVTGTRSASVQTSLAVTAQDIEKFQVLKDQYLIM
jgi:hypothetical protein